jgi:hypothetical protein
MTLRRVLVQSTAADACCCRASHDRFRRRSPALALTMIRIFTAAGALFVNHNLARILLHRSLKPARECRNGRLDGWKQGIGARCGKSRWWFVSRLTKN